MGKTYLVVLQFLKAFFVFFKWGLATCDYRVKYGVNGDDKSQVIEILDQI